jgi:cell division protein FtsZ
MGIAIDSAMGSRLSVSIISSLGGSPERLANADYPALEEPERLEAPPTLTAAALPEPVVNLRLGNDHSTNGQKMEARPSEEAVILEPAVNRPAESRTSKKEVAPEGKAVPKAPPKKIEAKQEVLQFDAVSRGRFEKSEPTIVDGQDLDVPTFLRTRVKVG